MLDEAQLVAATSSVAAQMTSSLWRRHAWVVTGTPITTRLDEIQVSHYLWSVQLPATLGPVSQCSSGTQLQVAGCKTSSVQLAMLFPRTCCAGQHLTL